jgi:hypothetical protein
MLRILSDLTKVDRYDVQVSADVLASGVTGTFVSLMGSTATFPAAGALGVMQVFTESYRDGSAGKWSPDTTAAGTNQLTVVYGKYRAVTDQYTGAISVGNALKVNTAGKLIAATVSDGNAVAVCTRAAFAVNHLGQSWTVIEFVTL